ncbi:uncharacterized protein N7479_006130 [Penicillium vulpinum]|uniref:Uncharacterized protein n=1 Tax=Penicillium vulpinum TaxID=29845 RepID=A0A1V6SFF7_9EURO|nr:uncharacterized protein N7479_006130 [Penicillium vulpinum]KAJ5958980.1 hypothetical protein N7479_006130 [Penicillium vulpinum]OQE12666.1 hypothetical protein PENVUL_c001G03717 [Penicillium vulpinum]
MSGSSDNRWRGGPSRQASQRNSNNRDKTAGQGNTRDNNAAWSASNPPQEPHVPVRGFNSTEVKNVMKPGPDEMNSTTPYKSHSKDGPTQRSTAWGPKAQNMANGKDFFLELRKQIASLQRSGPSVGG